METLKFLMITTHFPPYHLGGDAVFVDYLSKELAGRGHEVHVMHSPTVFEMFRPGKYGSSDDDPEDEIHRHPYKPRTSTLGTLMALSLGTSGRQTRMASDIVHSVKPDVVHWHNTRGFFRGPFLFGNEIALYTSHDYGFICPRSNLLRPDLSICNRANMCTVCSMRWKKPPQIWRLNGRRVLKYPDNLKVIAPSQFVANRLNEEGVNVHSVLRNFVPDPGPNELRTTGERDSLVYLGMLEAHKGLRTLIKAFMKSQDSHGFVLDIIGEGTLKPELIDSITKAGLTNRIRVHGFLARADAESLRKRAVAQIVPSEWLENCPLTILEAFSHGIPVIGSNMGGIPELVGPDSGSRVFSGGDADSLAEVILSLWNQRDESKALGEQARRAYDRLYRPELHLDEYLRLATRST